MGTLILSLLLVWFVGLKVSLRKTYKSVPLKELRRRARAGNKSADAIYKVACYETELDVFLWFEIGLASAILFVIVVNELPIWGALPAIIAFLWFAFAWIPSSRPTSIAYKAAVALAPPIAKLLSLIKPVTSNIVKVLRNFRPSLAGNSLYEKEDLLELLNRQTSQIDNRISNQELAIARNALSFGDKKIGDIMTPKRVIKDIWAGESVTPHMMDELHTTGFSRFPVLDGEKGQENVVGTLYMKDLVDYHQTGLVRDVMKHEVFYVNEQQPLHQALDAFIKTKHHLFIVVNNFEEVVGVVSIEDVLEQVLGREIIDEFDQYDDMRAVANIQAIHDRKHITHTKPPQQTSEEVIE